MPLFPRHRLPALPTCFHSHCIQVEYFFCLILHSYIDYCLNQTEYGSRLFVVKCSFMLFYCMCITWLPWVLVFVTFAASENSVWQFGHSLCVGLCLYFSLQLNCFNLPCAAMYNNICAFYKTYLGFILACKIKFYVVFIVSLYLFYDELWSPMYQHCVLWINGL